MPTYGDFNKDTKDLLTKNYAEKGAWKVESKGKGPEKTFIFNPTAASGKPISMDVEYNMKPIKTKTNFTEAGTIKPKITFEQKPHKVEGTVEYNYKDGKSGFEASYEFKIDKVVAVAKYDHKKGTVEVNDSISIGSGINVGTGIVYNLNTPDLANNWNFGVHYAAKGLVANWTTTALKSWTLGANYPVTISGNKITAGFQIDNKMKWTVGGEADCFNCPNAKLRLRVNQDFTVATAWIAKVAGGWKAAIGADIKKDLTFSWGTTFTYE